MVTQKFIPLRIVCDYWGGREGCWDGGRKGVSAYNYFAYIQKAVECNTYIHVFDEIIRSNGSIMMVWRRR